MEYKKDSKIIYAINIHVNRELDNSNNEKYNNHDYYNSNHDNLYKVVGVEINGKSVSSDGTIYLKNLNNNAEQIITSALLNGTMIHANKLSNFEIYND